MLGISENQQVRLDWREHERRAGERPNRKSRVDQDRTGFSREGGEPHLTELLEGSPAAC